MTATLIVLLIIVALIGVSLALGRTSREAQAVRDDEFVELDGSWIRYRVTGQGPPVLLVHGLLSSSRIWEPLAKRLSGQFTVYSLDLRGFGESDKPLTGYGVRHGSRVLYAFCSHFRLNNAAIVGHDVGGDMVVKLAADHPEFARSVTLVAVPANEDQMDLPTSLWLATLPVIGPLFYVIGQYADFVRKLWLKPFVSDKRDLPEELMEDAAASVPAALRSTFNTVRREISRERVARQARHLQAPVLVLAGEEDQIVDPQAAEVWAGSAPRSEVAILEGCGHLPMSELPEEFSSRLLTFLAGNESGHSRRSSRAPREEASSGMPREVRDPRESGQDSRGIDGLEPDEEASAAETAEPPPRVSRGPVGRGGRLRRAGAARREEDDTGEMGYVPEKNESQEEEQARKQEESREEGPEGRQEAKPAVEPGEDPDSTRRVERQDGGGRPGGEDIIPELPDDLFRWSDVRKGRRRGRGEENGGGRESGERGD
ncbi:alpha/beta fold hydrolase [Rubrobacter aplysinae]|uniref:alpha/beta fold hydrolase n=1 Tax=Rubrobacter aplysinae TaxID=909625 RepID=UPI00128B053A|nr:alpha/beta hydrolase [Rubrobacter aplysinae]